jgi:hypothetical protein
MRCSTTRKLSARRTELLHDACALAGHPPNLLNRSLKASEFTLQLIEGRLNPIAQATAAFGKEEIAGRGADNRANQRSCCHCRPVVHTSSLLFLAWLFQNECQSKDGAGDRGRGSGIGVKP